MLYVYTHQIQYILQFPPIITRVTNNCRKGFVALDKRQKLASAKLQLKIYIGFS